MRLRLIPQERFMEEATNRRLAIPSKLNNGYFMVGNIGNILVYSTINKENYNSLMGGRK